MPDLLFTPCPRSRIFLPLEVPAGIATVTSPCGVGTSILAPKTASAMVIAAHNPVRGLDIAATRFVFAELLAQRGGGAGILLIHSDLDELLALADRVSVMHAGRCMETNWPDCTREQIGRLMLVGAS